MPQPHIHKNISNSIRRVIHDTRNLSDNPTYGISKRLLASALAIVAGSAVAVGCASAEGSVEFSLTVPDTPVLEVVIQGTDAEGDINLSMAPTMAKADFNTADVAVTVGTSSTAGYNLKMAVGNSGQLVSGGNSIPSLAAAEDENGDPYSCTKATKLTCNFTVNSWGYWMTGDTANNYKPIPSAETELANYTTGATNGVTTELEFGVRVNAKQAGGDYQTTINFIATANPETTISMLTHMQDFAVLSDYELEDVLRSMNEGQSYTLVDSRDNKTYNIAKLKGGNVWLQDNLQLDIAANKNNITSTNTNANNDALTCLKDGCSSSTTYSQAAASNTNKDNWSGDIRYTQAMYNIDNANYDASYGNGTYKSGYYYNYCAASAGSYCYANSSAPSNTNATQDICPAGWQMPAGDTSIYSYQKLYEAYGSNAADFKNALHVGLSGYFNGGIDGQGSNGDFWASTFSSTSNMRGLVVDGSDVSPQGINGRYRGFSVRCVLKPYVYDMQNVSAETMASILSTNGSTYVMKDNRDGTEYTIGKLADGNYWMLDNLALDPSAQELNSSNTNVTSTVTTTFENKTSGWDDTSPNDAWGEAYFNLASKDILVTYGSGNTKVGGYYNYCAASAGTYCYASGASPANTNTTSDICPAGWKMPNGDTAKGSYYYLFNTGYSGNKGNFKNALHAGYSGNFWNSSVDGQGSSGYGVFWSATRRDGSGMYRLFVEASIVNPQSISYRHYGHSVRCMYGG